MGDFEGALTQPDRNSGEGDETYWDRVREVTDRAEAMLQGATAPAPPDPPVCPECGQEADRFPTYSQAWVLLEPLEPVNEVPAHFVPPRQRWLVNSDGVAWNPWEAEPTPGAVCRIAHRLVCPGVEPLDLWPWLTAEREESGRRAQRLFNPPRLPAPDEAGAS
ncbi:DUF6083 domain-containing protein [Streptomyces sp. MZ04]|uniref:DUF6083 domain-containing protein n=1 Tax=Streptomyces sp. MZ04 TaxID=2559236 RepID=UPI00107E65F1|nr:DUF6083 domain-containing protein [Streptomyces sp. MZ04]TGB06533.1 hypothetical protein E2651_23250 [Streptomyces sp. MZ04]